MYDYSKLNNVNTEYFSEAANHFKLHGNYTNAPFDTKDYIDYWNEQKRRRIEGYEVGGCRITGLHYGYLNFSRMLVSTKINNVKRKIQDFPRFYDMDYFYFHELEKARQEGLGIIVAKARRKGFSYKNAWVVANEFNLVENSISVIASAQDKFGDNTVGMVIDDLDFLNKNTGWVRYRNPDRREFMKAQIEIDGTWQGLQSEIHKISFKDNPFSGVGKSSSVFLWEEAGTFNNLIKSYRFSEPTWRDGDDTIGMPIVFGTGGDMEKGTQDFAYMFYNPDKFGLKAFKNIWDENKMDTNCGYFVPDYIARPPHINEYGISDMEKAKETQVIERDKMLLSAKKKSELDEYISQYCFSPREAFLIRKGNIFPAALIANHLSDIESNKHKKFLGQTGRIELEPTGDVKWHPDDSLRPLDYPIEKDNEEGCIMIYEHPAQPNKSPYGLYYATCDPYDMDDSTTGSVLSCIIWKTFRNADECYDLPVATYHGRPEKAKEAYEIVRKLVMYYNALLLYENEKRGLEWYFEEKKCLFMMKDQPSIIDKIIKKSTTQRPKGIHMVDAIKDQGLLWAKDWILEQDGEGNYNVTKIYDKFLLKQLIAYEDGGNYDSVIAFILQMIMKQEMKNILVQERKEDKDPFWGMDLFKRK